MIEKLTSMFYTEAAEETLASIVTIFTYSLASIKWHDEKISDVVKNKLLILSGCVWCPTLLHRLLKKAYRNGGRNLRANNKWKQLSRKKLSRKQ